MAARRFLSTRLVSGRADLEPRGYGLARLFTSRPAYRTTQALVVMGGYNHGVGTHSRMSLRTGSVCTSHAHISASRGGYKSQPRRPRDEMKRLMEVGTVPT